MRRRLLIGALAVAPGFLGAAACEDVTHRDIGDEINILVRRDDQLVPPATERLAAYRRRAIPQIETALHTAAPTGRIHLVTALDRVGDEEAVPVLRHVATYDMTADVRAAAEGVLTSWAGGADARAARARAAVAEIARRRAAGEGPILFGDGGLPGAPSTVGAPEPVGAPPH
ncbi:MAG TPA: hypothetical protein VK989_05035 [Polyangia bacterium]|jgi:hypothetical protein|nr:hypothetical protein [Polyangia bacterium]